MFIFYIDEETGNRSKCETNDTVKDSRWKLQVSIQKIYLCKFYTLLLQKSYFSQMEV